MNAVDWLSVVTGIFLAASVGSLAVVDHGLPLGWFTVSFTIAAAAAGVGAIVVDRAKTRATDSTSDKAASDA